MESLRMQFYRLVTKIYKDVDYPNIPIPIYAMFYVIASQYLKNVKISFGGEKKSLRLSYFWVGGSRTGKGQLMKIAQTSAEKLGLKCAIVTDITDAGLLGSIDEKAIDYNNKNKLKEGDKDYKCPVIYGDLFNYDIIIFRECKKLLIPTNTTEMLLSILQEALDEPGYLRKKLKSQYPIEGESTISLVATTYFMNEIEKTLVDQGFFMRVPLYVRDLSIDEVQELREGVIDMYGKKNVIDKKKIEKDIQSFVDNFKKVKQDDKILTLDDSAIERLKDINKQFFVLMRQTTGHKLNILKSLSQLIIDISVKIGGIHACLDNVDVINKNHINPAFIFIKACTDTILNKIELIESTISVKSKTINNAILNFRLCLKEKNTDRICKEDFCNFLKSKGLGRNKALNIINKLISDNYIKVDKGEKNTKNLIINNGY